MACSPPTQKAAEKEKEEEVLILVEVVVAPLTLVVEVPLILVAVLLTLVAAQSVRLLWLHHISPPVADISRPSIARRRSVNRILADSPESQHIRQSRFSLLRVRGSVRIRA